MAKYSISEIFMVITMVLGVFGSMKLSKYWLNKSIIVLSFSSCIIIMACCYFTCMNKVAFCANYVIHNLFFSLNNQLICAVLVLSVPVKYSALVSTLPVCTRTLG